MILTAVGALSSRQISPLFLSARLYNTVHVYSSVQCTVQCVTDIVRQSETWPGNRRMCPANIRGSLENMWHVNIYWLWRHRRNVEVATRLEANKTTCRWISFERFFVCRKCLHAKQNITGIGENCFVRWWRLGWVSPCSASSSPRPSSSGRRGTWSWTTKVNKPKVKFSKVMWKVQVNHLLSLSS